MILHRTNRRPLDAINWSEEHGSRWINEMCQQFNLNPPRRPFLNGRTLLNMSETEFRNLSPEGGDTLYAQLQLWKTGMHILLFEMYLWLKNQLVFTQSWEVESSYNRRIVIL